MKLFFWISLLLLFANKINAQPYAPEVLLIDLKPYEREWIGLPEHATLVRPSKAEWQEMDNLVSICFEEARKTGSAGRVPTMSLEHYVRQYVVYQLPNGHKQVYVNAGPYLDPGTEHPNRDLIIIMDGGPDYWQMTVDLSEKTCVEFHANGEG